MHGIARLAVRRPVAVTVLAVAVSVLGVIAWRELPLDLLPDIQSPTVLVAIRAGDRPPAEMERLYGEQVEQRLFTVRGLRAVDEVARTGVLVTRVTFDWDADMDLALVDVQKAVGPIAADPEVDDVRVRRFDPRQLPVLSLGLVAPSGRPDLAELRRAARRQVAPALEQLEGVAEVRVSGGRELEVRVRLDRALVEAHGLTLGEIESRIRASNLDLNAGTLEEGDRVLLVRGLARFRSPVDVGDVVVSYRSDAGGQAVPVRVRDLGAVALAEAEVRDVVRVDGSEGIGLAIYKEAGANTVAVSRTVRHALDRLGADLPGVEVRVSADEAAIVEDAVSEVEGAAAIGIVLAILVLVLFLRSAGPTVVVAVAVPVSLLTTVFAMRFAGYSLNLMTLGGLALGAGMLVDNAIVVVESIFRRRDEGDPLEVAAWTGAGVVGGAIAASTITTCVVFLPVLFVRGLAARLVAGIAFTVVVSLLASLVVAVALIPALAGWLLPRRPGRTVDPGSGRLERLVARLLERSVAVVLVAGALSALGVWSLVRLGSELLPPADPRQFAVRVVGPPGQRVEATERMVGVVEDILREAGGEDVAAVLSEVGRLPDDDRVIREEQTEENTARIRVRLAAGGRTASQVVRRASPAVAALNGVDAAWEVGGSALGEALGTSGPPVVVEVTGRSLPDLRLAADRVRGQLAEVAPLWNVQSSFEGGPPELRVVLRRPMADALGLDLDAVAAVLEAALDGRRATTMTVGDEEYEVRLRLGEADPGDLANLVVTTAGGSRVALGEVARFERTEGAREIYRRDQRRVARVTARIRAGFDAPQAVRGVRQALAEVDLPPGLTAQLVGEEAERGRTVSELAWAGGLALLLVLMVLAGTFESLLHPLTVLAAVPLSLIGVALALVPGGRPVGVMAMLGLIVLAGVTVNDAILLVDAARRLIGDGLERRRALARAAAIRLRPIVMTTATTVLALVPLAIGGGEAAELRTPLALTVVGGLLASTVGSLLVIPCVYDVLERVRPRGRV